MSLMDKFLEVESAGSNGMNSYSVNRCCRMPRVFALLYTLTYNVLEGLLLVGLASIGIKALQGIHVYIGVWRVIYKPL